MNENNDLISAIRQFEKSGELSVPEPLERKIIAHTLLRSSSIKGTRHPNEPKWIVESSNMPLNNYHASTLSVFAWIENAAPPQNPPSHTYPKDYSVAWNEFLDAYYALRRAVRHYSPVSIEPRVAFDPLSDTNFFVFPLQSDGDTYVVSRLGIIDRIDSILSGGR